METKDLIGYEDRYSININGYIFDKKKSIKINSHIKDGYSRLVLSSNKKQKSFYLHRLIAIHFVENNDNKPYVNHIDGNKLNNSIENLEWVTHKENINHAHRIGLIKMHLGELSRNAKLTNEDVLNIVKDSICISRKEIQLKYNVSKATVQSILIGRNWSHITGINIKTKN